MYYEWTWPGTLSHMSTPLAMESIKTARGRMGWWCRAYLVYTHSSCSHNKTQLFGDSCHSTSECVLASWADRSCFTWYHSGFHYMSVYAYFLYSTSVSLSHPSKSVSSCLLALMRHLITFTIYGQCGLLSNWVDDCCISVRTPWWWQNVWDLSHPTSNSSGHRAKVIDRYFLWDWPVWSS